MVESDFFMSLERNLEKREKFFWSPMSFDADGVLINNKVPVVRQINKILGTDYGTGDIKTYYSADSWFVKHGRCNLNTAHLICKTLWSDPELLRVSYPMPGACEFMLKLYRLGLKPSIITIREPSLKDMTLEWFQKWMPWISKKQIFIQEPNSQVPEKEFKSHIINEMSIHAHFEDSLDQALNILNNTSATVFLVPFEYNRVSEGNPRLIRIPGNENNGLNINKLFSFLLE